MSKPHPTEEFDYFFDNIFKEYEKTYVKGQHSALLILSLSEDKIVVASGATDFSTLSVLMNIISKLKDVDQTYKKAFKFKLEQTKEMESDKDLHIRIIKDINVDLFKAVLKLRGLPQPSNDDVVLASIHKARLVYDGITEKEKEVSAKWLTEHNYSLELIVNLKGTNP